MSFQIVLVVVIVLGLLPARNRRRRRRVFLGDRSNFGLPLHWSKDRKTTGTRTAHVAVGKLQSLFGDRSQRMLLAISNPRRKEEEFEERRATTKDAMDDQEFPRLPAVREPSF